MHALRPHDAWLGRWRQIRIRLTVSVGIVAAAVGMLLAVAHGDVVVFSDKAGVHVGGSLLRAARAPTEGAQLFVGDATLIISSGADATTRAAAVARIGGVLTKGWCTLYAQEVTWERCELTIGRQTLSAHDTYDPTARAWTRLYADGQAVEIRVPTGRVVPVPFPIGR